MRAVWVWAAVVLAGAAGAAPPVVPAEVKAEVGKPVQLTVAGEKGKRVGTAKTFDPAAMIFVRTWTDDPAVYDYLIFPNRAGEFFVPFWTEGETAAAVVKVVVGGQGPIIAPTPDKPPVTPPAKKHFMVVRPSGVGIAPDLEGVLTLPAWADVKAAGHTYADAPFGSLPAAVQSRFKGQAMPFLLVWRYSGDQIVLPDDAVAGKVPATDAEVRGLLK